MNPAPAPPNPAGRRRSRAPDGEENLAAFLAGRARRASDGALAASAAVGLLGAVGSVLWAGRGWALWCAASLCLVAFGFWGISDRELTERLSDSNKHGLATVRLLRALAAAVAAVAGLAVLFATLGMALGTWIS